MYEFRTLLDRFWIVRRHDSERYYAVKRALPAYRRLINEFLGWNLVVNEAVIKLEKVPPRAMPWMGIEAFTEKEDYCLLCALLLYLADREDGEQFLLSFMTESIETYLSDTCPVDWSYRPHRMSMVRVLRHALDLGLLVAYEGNSEGFANSGDQEVLYENTGLSRHMSVHFGRDISGCHSVEDFEALAWTGEDDPRRRRVNRVYRQLALTPGLYWSEGDQEDFDYVKNQRQNLDRNLREALSGELQVHKNGAFLIQEDGDKWGRIHPGGSALSDVALLLCAYLREMVLDGRLERRADDRIALTAREFRLFLTRCRSDWGAGWGKQLRACSDEKLCEEVIRYLTGWMLLEEREDGLLLTPAAAKWVGHYPGDYHGEEMEDDEPMEDV